jgi:hypothetical protein
VKGPPRDPAKAAKYYGLLGKAKKATSYAQRRVLRNLAAELEEWYDVEEPQAAVTNGHTVSNPDPVRDLPPALTVDRASSRTPQNTAKRGGTVTFVTPPAQLGLFGQPAQGVSPGAGLAPPSHAPPEVELQIVSCAD